MPAMGQELHIVLTECHLHRFEAEISPIELPPFYVPSALSHYRRNVERMEK